MSELEVVLTASVAPPSVVSTSWLPAVTVMTQVVADEQSIEPNEVPLPTGCAVQLSPPSVELSSVSGPIA